MVKQISLDSWQIQHMAKLLHLGSMAAAKTSSPITLYRQVLEEEDGSYEEIVCTLTYGYVVEQLVTSGGVLPPAIHEQIVTPVQKYPQRMIRKSRDRFLEVVGVLEAYLRGPPARDDPPLA